MNTEQIRSLNVLKKITAPKKGREKRSTEFLGSPAVSPPYNLLPGEWAEGWCRGWAFEVQPALATALDIQLTVKKIDKRDVLVWTQGSTFSFKPGYTIYDTPEAWIMPWKDALHFLHYTVQVTEVSPVVPGTSKEARDPGRLTFCLYSPNAVRTSVQKVGEYTMTQDEFIRFLIIGMTELPEKRK